MSDDYVVFRESDGTFRLVRITPPHLGPVARVFKRRPRCGCIVTDRERAAATRSQKREQNALPVFAEVIAAEQPSIDGLMDERVRRWIEIEQARRDQRAPDWCRARRALATLPNDLRAAMLRYRNEDRWLPADPNYLLDALHSLSKVASA